MTSQAKETTDHGKIRRWAEMRGGKPATVRDTAAAGGEAGILRIAFGDEEDLEETDWDGFFDKFEAANLAFLYEEETPEGEPSRFCKFVARGP